MLTINQRNWIWYKDQISSCEHVRMSMSVKVTILYKSKRRFNCLWCLFAIIKHTMVANMGHSKVLTPFAKGQIISMSRLFMPTRTFAKDSNRSNNAVTTFSHLYYARKVKQKWKGPPKLSEHQRRLRIGKASNRNYSVRRSFNELDLNIMKRHVQYILSGCETLISGKIQTAPFLFGKRWEARSLGAPKVFKRGQLQR